MAFNYKFKLMVMIGLFSLLSISVVSFVNQWRFTEQLESDYELQTSLIKDNVLTAVSDVDKAYLFLNENLDQKMEQYSNDLAEKYKQDPDFSSWKFNELKRDMEGIDLYIINEENVIVYSSFPDDIGLDFTASVELSRYLDRIRTGGNFVADAIDAETLTGNIRKYSYMPTFDQKYIIELGYLVSNSSIFEQFNFAKVIDRLKQEYSMIEDIIVYSADGVALGTKDENGGVLELDARFAAAAEKLRKGEEGTVKVTDDLGFTHEFVPYRLRDEVDNYTDFRLIETIYDPSRFQEIMQDNRNVFVIQLIVSITITLLISILVARIISKPMYLAFHDSLTGLANRASFYVQLEDKLKGMKKRNQRMAVLLLDLDHFKTVNDTLGHDGGDSLLKEMAKRISGALHSGTDIAARLGGDEFAIILNDISSPDDAVNVAKRILEECQKPLVIKEADVIGELKVTTSIGIVLLPGHGEDAETIYQHADSAMYSAKRAGKNHFVVFDPEVHKQRFVSVGI